ncbi:uncharacterized protein BCR38DRAFT_413149 [Pseudomassariella vexata]|uniref:Uncharacterized protein n=1 Tax=Pseudomassariella vexata TaxID=1141098 RepID=A0A1Y2DHU9_9PEZI|nr:uncharacterized protein BCR38DRAFT_413149 [Pseudomassariella vexata]ORY58833.1 hypothetical protein BCR38DRAFT_413149 [Pseudomassariella vexata]
MSRSSPLNGSADFRCNINDHLVDGPLGPGDPRPFGVNLTTVNLTQAPYCSCGQFNRCGFHPQQTGPGVVFDSFPDTSAPAYQNNTATTYLRGLPVDTTITQGAGAQFGSTSADYSTIQDNGQNWPGSIPYEDLGDDKQPDPNIGGCDDQFSPGNPSCPTVPGIRNIPFLSSLADYYQQTSYSHPPTTSAGSVPAEPSLSGPGLNSTTYAPSSASESVCAYSFYENFEPFDVPAPPLAPPGSQSCLAPHSEGSSPETQHYKTPIDSQELSSNISAQGSLASAFCDRPLKRRAARPLSNTPVTFAERLQSTAIVTLSRHIKSPKTAKTNRVGTVAAAVISTVPRASGSTNGIKKVANLSAARISCPLIIVDAGWNILIKSSTKRIMKIVRRARKNLVAPGGVRGARGLEAIDRFGGGSAPRPDFKITDGYLSLVWHFLLSLLYRLQSLQFTPQYHSFLFRLLHSTFSDPVHRCPGQLSTMETSPMPTEAGEGISCGEDLTMHSANFELSIEVTQFPREL